MFTTALAILWILKPRLLFADLEVIMKTIKDSPNIVIDEAEFIKIHSWVTLPEWVVEELKGF